MKNILSIDVESWVHFYGDALKVGLPSAERKVLDSGYIIKVLHDLLNLLDVYKQKATFFVVAEIYDWYPDSIREIQHRGHEIGFHTHDHSIVTGRAVLEQQLVKSERFIEEFHPLGFRAPQIIVTPDVFSCLRQYGFKYSSSTYDDVGNTVIDGITEIPVSTFFFRSRSGHDDVFPKKLSLGRLTRQIPFGSGLFLSLLGSQIQYFIDRFNKQGKCVTIFAHPWQIFPHASMHSGRFLIKLLWRNPLCLPYVRNVHSQFEKLLKKYTFISFRDMLYGQ